MSEQENRNEKVYEFQPYRVHVFLPEGSNVSFFPFSVSGERYKDIKRGIANIEIDQGSAKIHVYIKSGETQLFKLPKGGEWELIPQEPPTYGDFGDWIGYIEGTIVAGDPPIAVG